MRAVVHDRYGPVEGLRLDDVATPEPAPDEVLEVLVDQGRFHPGRSVLVTARPARWAATWSSSRSRSAPPG